MWHFNEQIEENNFFFDYKIKTGPCKTRNAIKLLGICGYPASIISEALELVAGGKTNNMRTK